MSNHYDQLLHDLFVTAMEGGVNYWASLSLYKWSTGDGHTEDLMGFSAVLHDDEGDTPDIGMPVTREVMDRGYRLAVDEWRRRISWNCDVDLPRPDRVTEDGWDHDAGDADVIVQLGLFGDVIYG
jgi:hypothetical protein